MDAPTWPASSDAISHRSILSLHAINASEKESQREGKEERGREQLREKHTGSGCSQGEARGQGSGIAVVRVRGGGESKDRKETEQSGRRQWLR